MQTALPTSERGLTLIELLVVMGIVALMVMSLSPKVEEWTSDTRVRTGVRDLRAALKVARGNAVREGGRWVIAKDVDLSARTECPDMGDSGNYALWKDTNGDGKLDADERIATCRKMPRDVSFTSFSVCGDPDMTFGWVRDGGSRVAADGTRLSFYAIVEHATLDSRSIVVATPTGRVCDARLAKAADPPDCDAVRCPF